MYDEKRWLVQCSTGEDDEWSTTHVCKELDAAYKIIETQRVFEDSVFRIVEEINAIRIVDTISVPGQPMSLEEIAEEIISNSVHTTNIYYSNEYNALNEENKAKVFNIVNDSLCPCDYCGEHVHNGELTHFEHSGDFLCDSCYADAEQELEDEEQEYED